MNLPDKRGFTLTELLIVISIIGLFSAIVMVNFRHGRESDEFRRVSTELHQNFRLAQNYSIGGNSIKYCERSSTDHEFYPCEDNSYCNLGVGPWDPEYECKAAVPLGGYGINVRSTERYTLFGDTTADHLLTDSTEDFIIVENNVFTKGVHIESFRFGTADPATPSSENTLDVTFTPPTGTMNFYLNGAEAIDDDAEPYFTLELLLGSDFIEGSCRKVSLHRISGQISEDMSSCNW
ncbi:MAG: type II secretion system protein [Patescibacteria group bacterium]